MIQYDIGIYLYAVFMQFLNCRKIFLAGSVFCGNTALLVEFAQIIYIIYAVADIGCSGLSLIGRRHPHSADSVFRKGRSVVSELIPQTGILVKIPFKILHHYTFFDTHFSFLLPAYFNHSGGCVK